MHVDEIVSEFANHADSLAAQGHRRCRRAVPFDDLRQEALMGAVKAHAAYQPDRGAKLTTWIRNKMGFAVLDAIRAETKCRRPGGAPVIISLDELEQTRWYLSWFTKRKTR